MANGTRVLVFDLDGTLVDSAADLHRLSGALMVEDGLDPPSLEELRPMIGDGAGVLLRRAYAHGGRELDGPALAERVATFVARYAAEPCRLSEVYPGIPESLRSLRAGGARLGVCTNKPHAPAVGLLDALGLTDLFDAVVGGDAVLARKPHPDHLRATLDRLDTPVAEAVMIGDSENDFLMADALGVPCIIVSWGYSARPVRDLGARVIDRIEDLAPALALTPLGSTRS